MIYKNYLGKRLGNFNSNYYNDGIRGQCVWYVRGRAKEKLGVDTKIRGDAKTWYAQAKFKGKNVESDSIACFSGGSYGHVIYVESVESGTVYYTEANVGGTDGVLKSSSALTFMARSGYQGCIYLSKYKTPANKAKEEPAVKAKYGTAVTTAPLNYRKKPNGDKAGTLDKGVTVAFADSSKVVKGDYTWRKIYVNGNIYYVADKYLA